jgi:hypothetical protein
MMGHARAVMPNDRLDNCFGDSGDGDDGGALKCARLLTNANTNVCDLR